MTNQPTLPFGFTEHNPDGNWVCHDDDTHLVIRVGKTGEVFATFPFYFNSMPGCISAQGEKEEETVGYFLATAAQLAALPGLLNMLSDLTLFANDCQDKEVRHLKQRALNLMRKIGGGE